MEEGSYSANGNPTINVRRAIQGVKNNTVPAQQLQTKTSNKLIRTENSKKTFSIRFLIAETVP